MAERPVDTIPAEDAWAYTPEMLKRLHRARAQRGYVLGPDDLERIANEAEAAHREGREYHVSEEQLEAMEARNLAARDGEAAER
jgi:hypothetical protein